MEFGLLTLGGALLGGAVRLLQGVVGHVIRKAEPFSWKEVGKTAVTSAITGVVAGIVAPGADLLTSGVSGYIGSSALDKAFIKK